MKKMHKANKVILLSGLLVIFVFALLPGQLTPAYIVNHDKAAHALAFFIVALMLQGAFPRLALTARLLVLAGLALLIELMQFVLVGRGFSVEDLIYDAAGIVLFVLVSESFRFVSSILSRRYARINND